LLTGNGQNLQMARGVGKKEGLEKRLPAQLDRSQGTPVETALIIGRPEGRKMPRFFQHIRREKKGGNFRVRRKKIEAISVGGRKRRNRLRGRTTIVFKQVFSSGHSGPGK